MTVRVRRVKYFIAIFHLRKCPCSASLRRRVLALLEAVRSIDATTEETPGTITSEAHSMDGKHTQNSREVSGGSTRWRGLSAAGLDDHDRPSTERYPSTEKLEASMPAIEERDFIEEVHERVDVRRDARWEVRRDGARDRIWHVRHVRLLRLARRKFGIRNDVQVLGVQCGRRPRRERRSKQRAPGARRRRIRTTDELFYNNKLTTYQKETSRPANYGARQVAERTTRVDPDEATEKREP